MRVAEHFYSIQGEGATMGVPAVFLRLSGCNLLCGGQGTIEDKALHDGATWRCDTIETWMKGQKKSPDDLIHLFETQGYLRELAQGAHLVITGGEPMQQHEEIAELILLLSAKLGEQPYVEIETNGTIMPTHLLFALVNQWNISPKLANSGMPLGRRFKHGVLAAFARRDNAWCKMVVSDWCDLGEARVIAKLFSRDRVFLMPAASDQEQLRKLLPLVAKFCKNEKFRLSTRMQVEIWNLTVGV